MQYKSEYRRIRAPFMKELLQVCSSLGALSLCVRPCVSARVCVCVCALERQSQLMKASMIESKYVGPVSLQTSANDEYASVISRQTFIICWSCQTVIRPQLKNG